MMSPPRLAGLPASLRRLKETSVNWEEARPPNCERAHSKSRYELGGTECTCSLAFSLFKKPSLGVPLRRVGRAALFSLFVGLSLQRRADYSHGHLLPQ